MLMQWYVRLEGINYKVYKMFVISSQSFYEMTTPFSLEDAASSNRAFFVEMIASSSTT
jgi:hypothetical protein